MRSELGVEAVEYFLRTYFHDDHLGSEVCCMMRNMLQLSRDSVDQAQGPQAVL